MQLNEQHTGSDAPALRFETITITAGLADFGHLSSLVSPLMAAELPDFLWWPGNDFVHNPLFEDLQEIVDRVIVDTAKLGNDASGVAAMRDLLDDDDSGTPLIGDFTWLRLAPWRQLIAQFFDPPDVQQCLTSIEEVTISYADIREDGSSGFASALLTVGWLASRLGWEIMDPLERRKAGGWSAPLRASENGRGREIIAPPAAGPQPPRPLLACAMSRSFPGASILASSASNEPMRTTWSPAARRQSVPFVSRMVYAKRPTNEKMLGEELQRFGHDRVFEEALTLCHAIASVTYLLDLPVNAPGWCPPALRRGLYDDV